MTKQRESDNSETGPALLSYRTKRDFEITTEPKGSKSEPSGHPSGLPFVVQKHAASRMHYDFRLGWKGVLRSWAVTKGPSYYPGDKRLAVQVEDHPMEYSDFEGTIPKGQYGGGTVMVWDLGTWEPHGDVDRGFEEGRLKFDLHGTKLKGGWALIRMGGRLARDHKSSWLLIKEHDSFERSESSAAITEEASLSAISGRSMDQIANQEESCKVQAETRSRAPRIVRKQTSKISERNRRLPKNAASDTSTEKAPREQFPGFIAPQLAQPARKAPTGSEWVHELKLDGYRIQIHIQSNDDLNSATQSPLVKVLTRGNLDWSGRLPEFVTAAMQLRANAAILDGELVALDHKGISSFADLQAAMQERKNRNLAYFAFDLLHLNGRNLRVLPFFERKTILAHLLQNLDSNSVLHLSEHVQVPGAEMFEQACRMGAEGIVSKRISASYTSGRVNTWIKSKCNQGQEFVVGGFTSQSKSNGGIGALLLGYYETGKLHYAGRSGTGFSQRTQKELRDRLDPLRRKNSAFLDSPTAALRNVRWVDPKLVAQITFLNWTRDNLVRQAAFKGLREDKPPEEVIRETPLSPTSDPPTSVPNRQLRSRSSEPNLNGANMNTLAITHPEKVLDQTTGITKQELAAYYTAVSADILQYIANRPLSIVRCPEGSSKPCFFQKHVGLGVPSSVSTVPIPSKNGGAIEDYLTVDSVDGLVGLAQMGVLEIHSWGSQNDSLDNPDLIVFDLDPDLSIAWKTLASGALELRERLQTIGLQSYLKGTGGKGLHVVVPIRSEFDWPVIKQFSHAIAQQMEKDTPLLYVTKMTKSIRKDRIFVDYLRNDRGATSIAPFSPRARNGAPVALPFTWGELNAETMPTFRVANFAKWKRRFLHRPWDDLQTSQGLTSEILRKFGVKV